jgi:hypothetical protein
MQPERKIEIFSKNVGKNVPIHGINLWQPVNRTACRSNKTTTIKES